jgi:hypothetical protein
VHGVAKTAEVFDEDVEFVVFPKIFFLAEVGENLIADKLLGFLWIDGKKAPVNVCTISNIGVEAFGSPVE